MGENGKGMVKIFPQVKTSLRNQPQIRLKKKAAKAIVAYMIELGISGIRVEADQKEEGVQVVFKTR